MILALLFLVACGYFAGPIGVLVGLLIVVVIALGE